MVTRLDPGSQLCMNTAASPTAWLSDIPYAIVKAEGITVSDEDYKNDLSHYAELLGMTVEDMQKQYTEEQIRDGMLWDKVQQAVLDWATIVDEK